MRNILKLNKDVTFFLSIKDTDAQKLKEEYNRLVEGKKYHKLLILTLIGLFIVIAIKLYKIYQKCVLSLFLLVCLP